MKYLGLVTCIRNSTEYILHKKLICKLLGSIKVNTAMNKAEYLKKNLIKR